MFLYRYLFLIFVPVISYALPIQENPYSTQLYSLASNDSYSSGSNMRTINNGRYVGGGVASIFIGFGIGHAIQGRWKEKGWIHTVVQGGAVLAYIGSVIFTVGSASHYNPTSAQVYNESATFAGLGITLGIAIVILGSRIWEIIDAWSLPSSIKIVSSSQQMQIDTFSSLYPYNKVDAPGISLQWQF